MDHIIVSRGMLEEAGFFYKPDSIRIFNPDGVLITNGEPYRFGNKKTTDRGYSDHLPLTAVFEVEEQ